MPIWDVLTLQAQMLLSHGDTTNAEHVLTETLEKTGEGWRDGLRQMALLCSYTNRSLEAAVWIRKALQLCPTEGVRECAPLHADYGDILKDLSHLNRSAEVSTDKRSFNLRCKIRRRFNVTTLCLLA